MQEVEYFVDDQVKRGFFDSCKSVQFGATNGFAMDLIGGGAKTPDDFLKYMGDYRPGLGSPFQISIPSTGQDAEHPDQGIVPVKYSPLNCADNGLEARCTCVDCPDVCTSLPYVPPPPHPNDPTCTVGAVSCLTFSCLIIYAVLVLFGLSAYSWKLSLRHRQKRHERVALTDPPQPPLGSPTVKPSGNPFSHHFFSNHGSAGGGNGREELLTEVSSGRRTSGDGGDPRQVGSGSGNGEVHSTAPSGSSRFRLGRGASLLDPIEQLQPRRSQINLVLRSFFYRLGWKCATSPALTFGLAAVVVALLNIGWSFFKVETNPVRLWVSPSSETAYEKAYFDEHFGPFYRAQQVFVMGMPSQDDQGQAIAGTSLPPPTDVLSFDNLNWWLEHEKQISEIRSEPNGYTFQDVCFAPAGPGTPCAVQSISAWLGKDMSRWDKESGDWKGQIENCAKRPGECRADFGQTIDANLILGGVPGVTDNGDDVGDELAAAGRVLEAKALVVSYVVANSLDQEQVTKAQEWERALQAYLENLRTVSEQEANVKIAYTTEISLESELNKVSCEGYKVLVPDADRILF